MSTTPPLPPPQTTTTEPPQNLHGLSPAQFALLKQKTLSAKSHAYCPYSRFPVGACLLAAPPQATAAAAEPATYITGANVENASYPTGICAERTALAKAVTDGHRAFAALAVAADTETPASPCGMCRQFVREFCAADMPVFMFDREGGCVVVTLGELLPMSFGPEQLLGREGGERA
ncbi:hypothetical protein FGG08_000855 [Glutinoglossum americanum]|uniref:Cytidine deaminase n=1 Tax=Glutinoglossum americanum TaxID=1670608 RepID=A0A9P8L5U7_9PEZI|nr:hypothetical protein FGG08_000855 [Glutinoglossum americanum]